MKSKIKRWITRRKKVRQPNPNEETSITLSGDFDDPAGKLVKEAFFRALAMDTKLPEWLVRMEGMSGKKYRYFINNLISLTPDARYLEIGSWTGSTACSAIYGNKVEIHCIDNWSQFGGPKEKFLENIHKCETKDIRFSFIEGDFREVDYSNLGLMNVYLFDGPHTEVDHYDGIVGVQDCLDQTYTMIIDDWNWQQVREGTNRALHNLNTDIVAKIEIRTTQDNSHATVVKQHSDWHNGYFISVCRKSSS